MLAKKGGVRGRRSRLSSGKLARHVMWRLLVEGGSFESESLDGVGRQDGVGVLVADLHLHRGTGSLVCVQHHHHHLPGGCD